MLLPERPSQGRPLSVLKALLSIMISWWWMGLNLKEIDEARTDTYTHTHHLFSNCHNVQCVCVWGWKGMCSVCVCVGQGGCGFAKVCLFAVCNECELSFKERTHTGFSRHSINHKCEKHVFKPVCLCAYMSVCVCVCVCECGWNWQREIGTNEDQLLISKLSLYFYSSCHAHHKVLHNKKTR